MTHGTDTLEETAYFLNLVIKSDKAVVMTGAMRAPGSLGADSPVNLYEAVEVAAAPQSKGRGVMVVMNDQIHYARDVTKQNSMRLDAFQSPDRGPAGLVAEGHVVLFAKPTSRYGSQSQFGLSDLPDELPPVVIIYAYANMGREAIDAAVQPGVKGIVIAGVENGKVQHVDSAVRQQLSDGSLVRVMREWCKPFPGFYLYVPTREQMPPKVRAFMDFLVEKRAQLALKSQQRIRGTATSNYQQG
ncbi:MAG: asparaginase [Silvibacterium sp.]|nr:asparaginase [Silvibacterium sp.]